MNLHVAIALNDLHPSPKRRTRRDAFFSRADHSTGNLQGNP